MKHNRLHYFIDPIPAEVPADPVAPNQRRITKATMSC
jgi:hypothetical protein